MSWRRSEAAEGESVDTTPSGASDDSRDSVEPGDSVSVRAWGRVNGVLRPIAGHTLLRPSESLVAMTAHFDILPPNAPLVGEVLNDGTVFGNQDAF